MDCRVSAGHHMDVYASSIDDILEDEEHYADQLKEYLFYAEALRAVCRKHELMQYDLEMAAQDLASKKQQCEELATGDCENIFFEGSDYPALRSRNSRAERSQNKDARRTNKGRRTTT
ncbi:unnamed protein product [Rangifer tarandus platyrhynchus]|uniref:Uncharacterized protein n=1 Tax=Rangifer tarandus platyrhynchus TaxID=3082113 RepID=A0ABN8ZRS1_RANTA|nr:unnamed protein product [Rangifer tarandus platyrhynchus]